eukprot:439627_1
MEPAFQSSINVHAWNSKHNELAISPNTRDVWIFSAKDENSKNWKKIHVLSLHEMKVTDIDWCHTTNAIVTSSEDKRAWVWTQDEKKEWKPTLVVLRIHRAAICIKWSPNGNKFAVGSGSKQIAVSHYEKFTNLWETKMIKKGGKSSILCVDWSPNNMFIIAGGSDFICRVFSGHIRGVDTDCKMDDYGGAIDGKAATSFGKVLCEFDAKGIGWIESCVFSTTGMRFAFAAHNSTVHFGSFEGGKITIQSMRRRQLPLTCIVFLNDSIAIGAGYDCIPILYEYNGNKWIEKGSIDRGTKSKVNIGFPYRHKGMINDIEVYDETQFTTSSVDGNVLFWDLKQKY